VLAVGPTGSGKAALLYQGLRMLRRPRQQPVPMATIERTVRGRLDDAVRVVVSSADGVTFDIALQRLAGDGTKAFLVGEIPDLATAREAVRLTTQRRRLVLSTLHVPDAPSALQRLLWLGVPPADVGEAVALVLAPRALRRLCAHCSKPLHLPAHALQAAGFASGEIAGGLVLWEPDRQGCTFCTGGFRGRYHACELLPMTERVRGALAGADARAIRQVALEEGMKPLRRRLLDAAIAGDAWIADVDGVA